MARARKAATAPKIEPAGRSAAFIAGELEAEAEALELEAPPFDEALPELPLEDEPEPELEPEELEPVALALAMGVEEALPLAEPLAAWEAKPLAVGVAEAAGPEAEPEASAAPEELEPEPDSPRLGLALPVEEGLATELELVESLGHERSNRGSEFRDLTRPKLGLAPASWRMYHQVLVLPNSEQPTWSQNFLAFSTEAVALFSWGPLTGQPVSVIQTGLFLATALVLSTDSSNRDLALSMPLSMLFW